MARLPAYRVWLTYSAVWSFVGALSWTTAALYLVEDVGMTPLQLVLAGTALEVAYVVFEVPTGVVADLVSRRLSLVVAAVLSGAAMLTVGAVPSVPVVLAAMALWGFGWTFRSGAEDAWLADELGHDAVGPAYQRGAQLARLTGLAGIAAAVGLALVDRGLPFVAAGTVTLGLAVWLALRMPEDGFVRPERTERHPLHDAGGTLRDGARLVRRSPVLLLVVVISVLAGAWSEGFDRLWEAHLLLDVGFVGPDPAVWFGLLAAATLLLALVVAQPAVPRVERLGQLGLARLQLGLQSVILLATLGFALSGELWSAVLAYLVLTVSRDLAAPAYRTWLNGAVLDSRRRATVLSLVNVGDSAGELAGGPVIGALANGFGIRIALAASTLALAPALALWGRVARHDARAQLLDATGKG